MAFFCTKTGVRIAAAGVSKAVDPEKGHAEVVEVDGVEVPVEVPVEAPAKAKGKGPKADAPPAEPPKGDAPQS